jgi:hypothetical protein
MSVWVVFFGSCQMKIRALALTVALVFLALAVSLASSGYDMKVSAPSIELAAIPKSAGRWVGVDQDIMSDTARVLNAHSFINRVYRDDLGREITLHSALWAKPDLGEIAPHHPDVCYSAAGWQLMSRRTIYINEDHKQPLELILFQKDNVSIVTGHFYKIGSEQFTDGSNLGGMIMRLWGRESWPSTVKVLFQLAAPDLDAGQRTLLPFATTFSSQVDALSNPTTL